jgi:hypothetical protein
VVAVKRSGCHNAKLKCANQNAWYTHMHGSSHNSTSSSVF